MKDDRVVLAALMGILATIPYEIFTRIFLYFGIGKYSIYQLDGFIITLNRISPIFGFVISSMVAIVTASLLYYIAEKLGTGYLIIKSTLISLLAWAILETVFTGTIEGKFIKPRPISDYYIHMLGTMIFGITLGLLFRRFVFRSNDNEIGNNGIS